MVLLWAVVVGLIAGMLRAWWHRRQPQIPQLHYTWLAFVAFLPQWFALYMPAYLFATRPLDANLVAVALVSSQLLLLCFVWFNRTQPGFWLLALGLLMNFLVIVLNGGLMPVSPETVELLWPDAPPGAWQEGERLGFSKDIVLPVHETTLWVLSDRFIFPSWFPRQGAFSLGDVFIAGGVFGLLWRLGQGGDIE